MNIYEKFSKNVIDKLFFKHSENWRFSRMLGLTSRLTVILDDVPAIYSTIKINFSKKLYSVNRQVYGLPEFTRFLKYLRNVNYRKFTATVMVNDRVYYINSKLDLESLLGLFSEETFLRSLTRLGYVLSPKGTKVNFVSAFLYLSLFKYFEKVLSVVLKNYMSSFTDVVNDETLRLGIGDAFLNGVYDYGIESNYPLPLVESMFKAMSEAIKYEEGNKENLTGVVVFDIARANKTTDTVTMGIDSRERQNRFLVYFLGALEDLCRFSFELEEPFLGITSGATITPREFQIEPLTVNDRITVRFP